jgi:hypothetical protein
MADEWKCLHCVPPPVGVVIEARMPEGIIERRMLVTREDLRDVRWWNFTHWRAVSARGEHD